MKKGIYFFILLFLTACSSKEEQFLPVIKEKKKVININFWNLREVPNTVREHETEVETLRLSYNRLSSLPAQLGGLKKLTYLDVSHNRLKKLPAELGAISNLQVLLLSHNLLTEIPQELSALRLLKEADFSYNHLQKIPEFILGTLGMAKLNLEGNQIKNLHKPLLKNLENLQELNLANNRLRHLFVIDSSWINPALLKLNLRKNQIQAVTFNLVYSPKEIDLSENEIFYFNVWQPLKVHRLNLSHNKLTYLKDKWQFFSELKVLDLSGNLLSYLPKSFALLTHLDSLDLSYNKFGFVPEELLSLRDLKLLNLEGNNIPEKTIEWLKERLPNTTIRYERGYHITKKNRRTTQDSLAFPSPFPTTSFRINKDSSQSQ